MSDDEMRDEIAFAAPEGEPDAEVPPLAPAHQQDFFLEELIDWAERGVELDIVLTISGSHLAGRLVGGRRYFDSLAARFKSATRQPVDSDIPETLAAYLEGFHRNNYPDTVEAGARPFGVRRVNYIHLIDARWRTADGSRFPGNGTPWRGRLAAVDGFWIGKLD